MANDIPYINRFCLFPSEPVLPLVIENEISYMETLYKIKHKLNEVIGVVNGIYDTIIGDVNKLLAESEARVDAKIADLQNKVNQQLTDQNLKIQQLLDDVERQLAEQNAKIDEQLRAQDLKIDAKIIQLQKDVQEQIAILRKFVFDNNTAIYTYIDAEIQKVINMIPEITSVNVHNPINGKIEPIQETINFLNPLWRPFAEPAENWDNWNYYTAEMFDNSEITAWDWDIFGWDWLGSGRNRVWKEPVQTMRNPFTGEWDYIKDVINSLFQLHRELAITVAEFDGKQITCVEYDEMEIEAYLFDTESSIFIVRIT